MNKSASMGLADMMSALMMVFMFISIAFLAQLEQSHMTFTKTLNSALHAEFDQDLTRWKAQITGNNVVRFHAPFIVGSTTIPDAFQGVLKEFCPRYIKVLVQDDFFDGIQEVKVEGHTSKGWNKHTSPESSFINNIELSQQRAINVLSFCYLLEDQNISLNREWLEKYFHANGLASSKPVYINGHISTDLSRRVDFMIIPKLNRQFNAELPNLQH
jgi:chemotaxis protein MotB